MRQVLKTIVLLAIAICGGSAFAEYPEKAITIVNPYPPGGLGDVLARAIAQKISESMGTPVIVDNKPGANGAVGTTFVARSQPDGYTLGSVPMSTLAINPILYKDLRYKPAVDLTPITQAVTFANVLVASPDIPINSLAELPAYLKANSASLNFASQGNGSSGHLEGALLNLATHSHMTHVPYQGSGPAIQDLLSGRVQFLFETLPVATPYIKAGKIKALGVASAEPQKLIPNVPPISSVIRGFDATNWIGIIGPAGLPREIVAKLNEHIAKALRTPEIQRLADERGLETVGSSPEALSKAIAADTKKWADVVQESKIKND